MYAQLKASLIVAATFVAACEAGEDLSTSTRHLSLSVESGECEQLETVCTASEPPTCSDYCVDEIGEPDSDDCIEAVDEFGKVIVACPSDNCVVSFDAESGEESIECFAPVDGGEGRTEPGSPGQDDDEIVPPSEGESGVIDPDDNCETVCTASEPPQCSTVCDGDDESDPTPDGCVVRYDAETQQETLECREVEDDSEGSADGGDSSDESSV